ncbi:hypothetical protein [Clostridium sp.]|uniref:hypothetical protein n=1 Tax=Clostridium sp. TaxID=1506 RepID=UPI0026230675|nr:hypothetical protein [uncultured Clostridium sp.]
MHDLKGMSKQKKAEYIWEYYKLHIVGTLVALCIIISIIHGQITKPNYVFTLTMLSSIVDTNKTNTLESQLTKIVVKDGSTKNQAIVRTMPLDGSKITDTQMANQYMQKFIAEISVGELDIVVLNKTMFEKFAKEDMFLRLDNISGLTLGSLKGEKLHAIGSNKKNVVYGIDIKDDVILKKMGLTTKDMVIGIIASTKQKDNSLLVLKWLLNK